MQLISIEGWTFQRRPLIVAGAKSMNDDSKNDLLSMNYKKKLIKPMGKFKNTLHFTYQSTLHLIQTGIQYKPSP